jgi:hypothetical protein
VENRAKLWKGPKTSGGFPGANYGKATRSQQFDSSWGSRAKKRSSVENFRPQSDFWGAEEFHVEHSDPALRGSVFHVEQSDTSGLQFCQLTFSEIFRLLPACLDVQTAEGFTCGQKYLSATLKHGLTPLRNSSPRPISWQRTVVHSFRIFPNQDPSPFLIPPPAYRARGLRNGRRALLR